MSQNAMPPPLGPRGGHEDDEDAMFEQDLAEMLQDGPSLNDSSSNVLSGGAKQSMAGTLSFATDGGNRIAPATSNISLTSPDSNGGSHSAPSGDLGDHKGPFVSPLPSPSISAPTLQPGGAVASTKLESLRAWSMNTYKCTRQLLSERLGKGQRTVDADLEASITSVRDTQRRYTQVLRLSRTLATHARHASDTQRALADAFSELAQRAPHLQPEFACNADAQRTIAKNADSLIAAYNFFTSSINTLCNKTMEDTLQTVKQYETARVEYDAYRTDMDTLQSGPRDLASANKVAEARRKYDVHKQKYDKLRADVTVKLRFLEENKLKVMRNHLMTFQQACVAYYSGNHAALESLMKQFQTDMNNTTAPSFLER